MNFFRDAIRLQTEPQGRVVYLAEGLAEALFIQTILALHDADPAECLVFCFRGIDNLGITLRALSIEGNFRQIRSIGIMIDADTDRTARLQSVVGHLRNTGIVNERIQQLDNVIFHQNGRNFGIFVSPGDSTTGCIETLTCREIDDRPESYCLNALADCLEEMDVNLVEKSRSDIFLSIKRPGLSNVGRGFEAGILDVSHPAYERAVQLFVELMNCP